MLVLVLVRHEFVPVEGLRGPTAECRRYDPEKRPSEILKEVNTLCVVSKIVWAAKLCSNKMPQF